MKYSLLVIICSCAFLGCKPSDQINEEDLPAFKEDGVGYIQFINETDDSVRIDKFYSLIFQNVYGDMQSYWVPSQDSFVLALPVKLPQVYPIIIHQEMFSLFLHYDDTLVTKITAIQPLGEMPIGYFKSMGGIKSTQVKFEGTYADEAQYLLELEKKLGKPEPFWANNAQLSLAEYAYKIDSFSQVKDKLLDSAYAALNLDNLFYKSQKAKIYYSALESKTKQPGFLEFQVGSVVKPPKGYFSFLQDIDLNDPYAKYTYEYFFFLSTLSFHESKLKWEEKHPGFMAMPRKQQDSIRRAHWEQSLNKQDPEYQKSLFLAERESTMKSLKSLEARINPELYDLLIYHHAQLDFGRLNHTESKWAKTYYEEEFPSNPYLKHLEKAVASKERLMPGDKAPYFYLKQTNGQYVSPKNFLGKTAYLNFWAPWCKPCIEELPFEQKLHEKLKDEPVNIINICYQCQEDQWIQYLEENDMPGMHLFAEGEWPAKLSKNYAINGIPHYTLIDKEGKIIANPTYRPSDPQLYDLILENHD